MLKKWIKPLVIGALVLITEHLPADECCPCLPYSLGYSGYHKGFFIQSYDSDYSLRMNISLQNRIVYDHRHGNPSGPHTKNTWGLENTRDTFAFNGRAAKKGYYSMSFLLGAYKVTPGLDWTYAGWKVDDNFSVSFGRMHLPTAREWSIGHSYQLLANRAWTLSGLCISGINLQFGYERPTWRANLYVGNGISGEIDDGEIDLFTDTLPYFDSNDTYNIGLRLDWIVFGKTSSDPCQKKCHRPIIEFYNDSSGRSVGKNFLKFNQVTSKPGSDCGLLLGLWGAYETSRFYFQPGGQTAIKGHVAQLSFDAQAQLNGLSIYGIVWMIQNRFKSIIPEAESLGSHGVSTGALLESGYYLSNEFELFGRYEWAKWAKGEFSSFATLPETHSSILSAGFNWYLWKENAKVTFETGYSFFSLNNPLDLATANSTNFLNDSANAKGQLRSIVQLQLDF